MRIVSYNILTGGEGRADPLAEVIEAQRADVVGLLEADDVAVVERIANRLEMDYIRAEGNNHSAAILSRFPITKTINHAPSHPAISKCFLEAELSVNGTELPVGLLHLEAHASEDNERKREEEIAEILRIFEHYRTANVAHLLLGDFNSTSPIQDIDPAKLKPSALDEFKANGNKLHRRVMEHVFKAGYVDCLQATDEPAARTVKTFTTLHPGQRVDYILAWGIARSKIKRAWVELDRLAKYASDHYPVGAEIEI